MPGYSGGASTAPKYKPKPLTSGGGGSLSFASPGPSSAGKGSLDVLDLPGSVAQTAGSFAEFGGNVAGLIGQIGPDAETFSIGQLFEDVGRLPGMVPTAIGSIGPDGETASIGQLFEDIGRIPGGVGDFQLPYLGGDPNATQARLSEVPGALLDAVMLPGRAIARTAAGQRVEGAKRGEDVDLRNLFRGAIGTPLGLLGGEDEGNRGLPPDLQQRLDAGESVDVIADELLERGQAFSGGGVTNLVGEVIFDPLNVIAPGLSKAAGGVKAAGYAVQVPAQYAKMGLGARAAGAAYNTASRGMSAAGAAFVDKTLGPVTSGAFFALTTKPYLNIKGKLRGLNADYAADFDDALGVANGNLHPAVIADDMGNDIAARLATTEGMDAAAAARLSGKRAYASDELERRGQEMLERTAPAYLTETPEELAEIAASHLAAATRVSIEDARRIIGPRADVKTAQTTHWARYGRSIDDFGEARELARGGKTNIDLDRLTLIAEDTLTVERAADLAKVAPGSLTDEAMKYSVIANHFLGKNASDGDILAFVAELAKRKALPSAVKTPKTGKNKLPPSLGAWRQKWVDNGYDLGFAPEDGLKTIEDADGNIVWAKPWVGVTTRRDPVSVRNGLGRAVDSMRRGITQTTIVQQSRDRMVRKAVADGVPVSPNQIRSIHKAIVEEAANRSLTPRALVGDRMDGEPLYNAIFKKFLSDDEYAALTARYDPTYYVMHAFEGNLRTVGLSQKITGLAKRLPTIARITEGLYPKARFTYRPNFQLQEMVESPVFNAMRGIETRVVDPDVAKAYAKLAEQPEFRWLDETRFLTLAGDRLVTRFMGANTPVGRAMGRFTNIAQRKDIARIQQTLFEHGEEFKGAIQNIDPKAWAAMEDAYGTTDPRIIADRFLSERMALGAGEDISAVTAALDDLANPLGDGPVSETVWQVFKDSFRESSNRAFQTHFFNPQRGWLERSLNHPYLGFYPLSYMWGKVLPEFARFLIARPFGKKAPLTGLAALSRVQQAYVGALADDPEFRAHIESNAAAIYFANLIFPGNPTNLTVNAPAWARHIGEDAAKGRDININTVAREAQDTAAYALNPVSDLTTFGKPASDLIGGAEDIFMSLRKAAEQYDGQFLPTGAPPAP